jgi:hypothetical protein
MSSHALLCYKMLVVVEISMFALSVLSGKKIKQSNINCFVSQWISICLITLKTLDIKVQHVFCTVEACRNPLCISFLCKCLFEL